jgi:hypothetical protein
VARIQERAGSGQTGDARAGDYCIDVSGLGQLLLPVEDGADRAALARSREKAILPGPDSNRGGQEVALEDVRTSGALAV